MEKQIFEVAQEVRKELGCSREDGCFCTGRCRRTAEEEKIHLEFIAREWSDWEERHK